MTITLGDLIKLLAVLAPLLAGYLKLTGNVEYLGTHVVDLQSQIGEVNERLDVLGRGGAEK